MGALACSVEGGPIKRSSTNTMAARGAFRQEESGGSPREVSVKVGGPTRSSFSFSQPPRLSLSRRGTKFIIRYSGSEGTPRPREPGDYPRRRGRENYPARSRACGINILPNLQRLHHSWKTMAAVLITGVACVYHPRHHYSARSSTERSCRTSSRRTTLNRVQLSCYSLRTLDDNWRLGH